MNKRNPFLVIGLSGATEASFMTRANAQILADHWNDQDDVIGRDLEDRAFCARYGVPFLPRRYFVMQDTN